MTTTDGRSIAFPPRLDPNTGRWAWSEGSQSIRESIQILLQTIPGERVNRPRLGAGLSDFLYEQNNASTRRVIEERIIRTLRTYEERIELQSVLAEADPDDPESVLITIAYRVLGGLAAEPPEQISLRLALAGRGGA